MRRTVRLLARLLSRVGGRRADRAGGVATFEVTTPPDEVEAYWTDERLRAAQPREQRLDPPGR